MRAIVFFIYLCFLLLGGGNYLHAGTHQKHIYDSSRNSGKNQQVKYTGKDQGTTVIEGSDLDVDEEYPSRDDVKDGNRDSNKFFPGKYNLSNGWYLTLPRLFVINHYYTHFKVYPRFCGHSSPIYITHRVLRI